MPRLGGKPCGVVQRQHTNCVLGRTNGIEEVADSYATVTRTRTTPASHTRIATHTFAHTRSAKCNVGHTVAIVRLRTAVEMHVGL